MTNKIRYHILPNGTYVVKVNGKDYFLTGEQILAMMYTYLFKTQPELKGYFDE